MHDRSPISLGWYGTYRSAPRKRARFSLSSRCLHPGSLPPGCLYSVVKQPRLAPRLRWAPRLRCSQPCWLGQMPAPLLGAMPAMLAAVLVRAEGQHCCTKRSSGACCAVRRPAWTSHDIRLSNSLTSARGSRAIHTYTRPTSFSRANGTVGVEATAASPGRAGDNVFSIFLPIPANPAQNCARKHVGWRRQDPPRPRLAVRHVGCRQAPIGCHLQAMLLGGAG